MKPQELHQTVAKLLGAKLQPLITQERSLNLLACVEIYTTIFDTLVEVVTESQLAITNEGMNYLAQQYYDGVLVNGNQELDPDIFTQRARLEEIETKELAIIAVIFSGTDFALPVLQEIKKRQ
jgi:hypothetical protein